MVTDLKICIDIMSLHRLKKLDETKYRVDQWKDHYILPSINLEDLSITKNLLLFMHSRGRNSPGLFATADFKSIHVGLYTTDIELPYVKGTTIILNGDDPITYGRLHPCGDNNDMFIEIAANRGTLLGAGILIMTIQVGQFQTCLVLLSLVPGLEIFLALKPVGDLTCNSPTSTLEMLTSNLEKVRILEFLQRCAELILHDIALEDPSHPLQPDPGEVVLANEESQHTSLLTEVLEASYRVPPRYDMSRLRSFVFAKRDEYLDQIWNLRENPVYFKEAMMEWAEHRHEQVRIADGTASPQLGKNEWWEKIINTVVSDAYTSFHAWDCLSKHVEDLAALKDTYDGHTHDSTTPKDHTDAVQYLEFLVVQALRRSIVKWKDGLAASPQLRKHFAIDRESGEGYPKVPWELEKDKFLWLMEIPLFDDLFRLCVSGVMDAIEWMLCTNQQNRKRLTPWLVAVLSELSLLGELQRQLGLLNQRPVHTERASSRAKCVKEYTKQFYAETDDLDRAYTVLDELELVPFAMPFDKFNYPCHRRRTETTTRTMQEAEKALDKFWQHIDVHSVSTCGKSFHELFNLEFEERKLARTPDWSDDEAPRPTPNRNIIAEASLEDHLAATLHFEQHNEPPESRETVVTPKQKIKTRGTPAESPPSQDPSITHEADTSHEDHPKIAVSKRAMKTFSTLFFDDSHDAPPGELPWTEFLHAMASAGFTSQKLNGSAWIFETTNSAIIARRSIIFHEPHPIAKIQYKIARVFGRRLNRAYGWTADTFERAKKENGK